MGHRKEDDAKAEERIKSIKADIAFLTNCIRENDTKIKEVAKREEGKKKQQVDEINRVHEIVEKEQEQEEAEKSKRKQEKAAKKKKNQGQGQEPQEPKKPKEPQEVGLKKGPSLPGPLKANLPAPGGDLRESLLDIQDGSAATTTQEKPGKSEKKCLCC